MSTPHPAPAGFEEPVPGAEAPHAPATAGMPVDPLILATPALPLPPHFLPRISVEARGLSLAILATFTLVFGLHWAQKFFIPLIFGIFIAYTLNPLVVWLEHIKIPRILGSTLVMAAMLAGTGLATNSLRGQFQSILEQVPNATVKLSGALSKMRDGRRSTIEQMQAVATEIERVTSPAAAPANSRKSPTPVVISQPGFKLSNWLLASSMGAASLIGQALVVTLLVYFLLLSGDTFKRKLVKLTGPTLSQKKITVQILSGINTSIQNYMFMLLVTNALLALLMWGALWWIGLENAGAWAVAAGFLHIIPYFGPILIAATTGMAAFVQFETFSMMLLLAGTSLVIAALVGTFVTTWMTGKIAKMNAPAVFIGLLFWGWMWGISGLLLGIPIIVIIKVISEHIEGMQTIAELLGE